MSDEPRQLKLTPRAEGETKGKKEKKEEKANKWVVVLILVLTVIATLVFYFDGGRKQTSGPSSTPAVERGGLFGPKVYKF